MAIGLMILGMGITLIGGLWLLIVIFREGLLWGLGALFVPLVSLLFVVTHWEDSKRPFFSQIIGLGIMLAGVCVAPDKIQKGFWEGLDRSEKQAPTASVSQIKAPSQEVTAPQADVTPSNTALSGMVVCFHEVTAFHPQDAERQIGKFLKGSRLKVGQPHVSGKVHVSFKTPDGKVIQALCRPEDLR